MFVLVAFLLMCWFRHDVVAFIKLDFHAYEVRTTGVSRLRTVEIQRFELWRLAGGARCIACRQSFGAPQKHGGRFDCFSTKSKPPAPKRTPDDFAVLFGKSCGFASINSVATRVSSPWYHNHSQTNRERQTAIGKSSSAPMALSPTGLLKSYPVSSGLWTTSRLP